MMAPLKGLLGSVMHALRKPVRGNRRSAAGQQQRALSDEGLESLGAHTRMISGEEIVEAEAVACLGLLGVPKRYIRAHATMRVVSDDGRHAREEYMLLVYLGALIDDAWPLLPEYGAYIRKRIYDNHKIQLKRVFWSQAPEGDRVALTLTRLTPKAGRRVASQPQAERAAPAPPGFSHAAMASSSVVSVVIDPSSEFPSSQEIPTQAAIRDSSPRTVQSRQSVLPPADASAALQQSSVPAPGPIDRQAARLRTAERAPAEFPIVRGAQPLARSLPVRPVPGSPAMPDLSAFELTNLGPEELGSPATDLGEFDLAGAFDGLAGSPSSRSPGNSGGLGDLDFGSMFELGSSAAAPANSSRGKSEKGEKGESGSGRRALGR